MFEIKNLLILAGILLCGTVTFREVTPRRIVSEPSTVSVHQVSANDGRLSDYRMISGSESAVPFSVEAGMVVVNVTINGRPLPFMFDSGAEDSLTSETAKMLGLKTGGSGTTLDTGGATIPVAFAGVAEVRLGNAEMTNQQFAVISLPQYMVDRGSRPPLAGVIGYELLARFALRLDYDLRMLTLRPAQNFRYNGNGVRVPLQFAGKTPAVPAAIDGVMGRFMVDTGSIGALTLQRQFVKDHGFEARLSSALRIKSIGASGPFEAILMRLDRFNIAGSQIDRPATRFPSEKEGLPYTDIDGSIGYEILRQFIITFDYQHHELWFERSAAFGTKTGQGGAGFQAVKVDGGFRVITVLPSMAAATAGMRVDDLIVGVDAVSTESMSLSEFAVLMRQPAGTVIRFSIVRNGDSRPLALTLADLLP